MFISLNRKTHQRRHSVWKNLFRCYLLRCSISHINREIIFHLLWTNASTTRKFSQFESNQHCFLHPPYYYSHYTQTGWISSLDRETIFWRGNIRRSFTSRNLIRTFTNVLRSGRMWQLLNLWIFHRHSITRCAKAKKTSTIGWIFQRVWIFDTLRSNTGLINYTMNKIFHKVNTYPARWQMFCKFDVSKSFRQFATTTSLTFHRVYFLRRIESVQVAWFIEARIRGVFPARVEI